MAKLRFGYFIAPVHAPGQNPTAALERDLQFVEHLDMLGYDEVWFGEHHSAGSEIIASPEIMIAAAAQRAPRIHFGTGVTSLSYHNPLWAADRIMLLDHLTRGRTIFGVGPGSLPTDSAMIGLDPTETRELLQENLDIVVRLLRGETVSAKTRTHELFDAKLQLSPFSADGIGITVAAVASPTGARLAGRYGLGLLSIGATLSADGFNALAHHWDIMEERADANSATVDRRNWSLCSPFHIAETEEEARRQVAYGIEHWFEYFQHVAAFPQMAVNGSEVNEMIDFINRSGIGVIGTAEQARIQVQRLWDQSGGFGSLLQLGHDWANPQDTKSSAELFARDVFPHFQGQYQSTVDAANRARAVRTGHAEAQLDAVEHMRLKYAQELAEKA
ncbi:LLM class flavin-dependent oxidoreductase [Rhodococcus koreensis]|uniref:LLM class flavin-dependent oxidoreductase n=1 Tax=Rhodococcus koreensis TaxID=99653 RepID=UPI001981F199|nr:LLM class flavin-dependent oxidoreductase [Rhodococcus koreensis]QSE85195.1 LLM class flavin-dependent oxidoreductase [Rhodococcus koreensis]